MCSCLGPLTERRKGAATGAELRDRPPRSHPSLTFLLLIRQLGTVIVALPLDKAQRRGPTVIDSSLILKENESATADQSEPRNIS